MNTNATRKIINVILKDKSAIKLILLGSAISVICFSLSFFLGSLTLLVLITATLLSSLLLDNEPAKLKVQNVIKAIVAVNLSNRSPDADSDAVEVDHELDQAIESCFKRIIRTFIQVWYSNITLDESFTGNLKEEIAEAVKQIALRIQRADHPRLISNKLLPVVYSHIDILNRIQDAQSPQDQIRSFVSNENSVHPAAYSRSSEKNYLRHLTKGLLHTVATRKNYECKILMNLLREILACSVLLPLTDVLSDPAIIDLLVILATNPKVHHKAAAKTEGDKKVVLLENFVKQFHMNLYDDDGEVGDLRKIDENFFRDQEKLYTFMQHLKSKSNTDIDLLKFYLDLEHMNSELEKMSVITDPVALSLLQQKSEKLLKFYQCQLFQEYKEETKPDDLLQAHAQARKILEEKWRTDFYKSAEYFQLIYGDRERNNPDTAKFMDTTDGASSHQKMSAKFRHVLNMRGTVDGIEATEIPVWDALDHPLGNSSYYNSVTVKLRKERGQDLDSFMHAFFMSIEQETDVGEDVALMQFVDERAKARLKMKLKNVEKGEIYGNLFNITSESNRNQYSAVPLVKSAAESAIYFLASILSVPKLLLRVTYSALRVLPNADDIICGVISNFLRKTLDQPTLAKLINELEEKVFDTDPTDPPCQEELERRHNTAIARLGSVNKNSVKILSFLQNPVLNKHLVYCLIDTIAVELFPELNLEAKD